MVAADHFVICADERALVRRLRKGPGGVETTNSLFLSPHPTLSPTYAGEGLTASHVSDTTTTETCVNNATVIMPSVNSNVIQVYPTLWTAVIRFNLPFVAL